MLMVKSNPKAWDTVYSCFTYSTTEDAVSAAEALSKKLVIKGVTLKLMWGRSSKHQNQSEKVGHGKACCGML